MRYLCIVAAIGMVLWCVPAFAWAPGTHVYLVERITGFDKPEIVYGSVMPDFYTVFLGNPTAQGKLHTLTHYRFDLLDPSLFATGFASHNNAWGADYYAHLYYDPEADDIYSIVKLRHLSETFAISMQEAEDLFELTIDYLVVRDNGPRMGRSLIRGTSGPTHEQALVNAFAQPLADSVAGMTLEDAQDGIGKAVRAYQMAMRIWGEIMCMEEVALRPTIISNLASYLGVDTATAEVYFDYTVALCEDDYEQEMDRICGLVGAEMGAIPQYCLPLASWCAIVSALLIAGMSAQRFHV